MKRKHASTSNELNNVPETYGNNKQANNAPEPSGSSRPKRRKIEQSQDMTSVVEPDVSNLRRSSRKRKQAEPESRDMTSVVDPDVSTLRRSSRKRKQAEPELSQTQTSRLKKRMKPNAVNADNSSDKISSRVSTQRTKPRKKRGKAAKVKRHPDEGKLDFLKGAISLDTLYEIASHLQPLDLLHLSRVSKEFRRIFNPYTQRHVWRRARGNIRDLPQCPDGINEAQYASLVFENLGSCHSCDALSVKFIDYSLCMRICSTCYDQSTSVGDEIVENLSFPVKPSEVYKLVPYSQYTCPKIQSHIWFHTFKREELQRYITTDFVTASKQYYALRADPVAQKLFVEECTKATQKRLHFATCINLWMTNDQKLKLEEARKKTSEREREIYRRLYGLGWLKREVHDLNMSMRGLLEQPKSLTEQSWGRIRVRAERILLQGRLKVRNLELQQHWHQMIIELVPAEERIFVPNAFEASKLPSIHSILMQGNAGVTVTKENIRNVFQDVLQEAKSFKMKVVRDLLWLIDLNSGHIISQHRKLRALDESILKEVAELRDPRHFFWCSNSSCSKRPPLSLAQLGHHVHQCHNSNKWDDVVLKNIKYEGTSQVNVVLKKFREAEKMKKNAIVDVNMFAGRLMCNCGSPEVEGKRMGYAALMRHIFEEGLVSKIMRENCGKPSHYFKPEPVCNDHTSSNLEQLISVLSPIKLSKGKKQKYIPGVSEAVDDTIDDLPHHPLLKYGHDPTSWHQCASKNGTVYRRACRPCHHNHLRFELPTKQEAFYHLRAKHGYDCKTMKKLNENTIPR